MPVRNSGACLFTPRVHLGRGAATGTYSQRLYAVRPPNSPSVLALSSIPPLLLPSPLQMAPPSPSPPPPPPPRRLTRRAAADAAAAAVAAAPPAPLASPAAAIHHDVRLLNDALHQTQDLARATVPRLLDRLQTTYQGDVPDAAHDIGALDARLVHQLRDCEVPPLLHPFSVFLRARIRTQSLLTGLVTLYTPSGTAVATRVPLERAALLAGLAHHSHLALYFGRFVLRSRGAAKVLLQYLELPLPGPAAAAGQDNNNNTNNNTTDPLSAPVAARRARFHNLVRHACNVLLVRLRTRHRVARAAARAFTGAVLFHPVAPFLFITRDIETAASLLAPAAFPPAGVGRLDNRAEHDEVEDDEADEVEDDEADEGSEQGLAAEEHIAAHQDHAYGLGPAYHWTSDHDTEQGRAEEEHIAAHPDHAHGLGPACHFTPDAETDQGLVQHHHSASHSHDYGPPSPNPASPVFQGSASHALRDRTFPLVPETPLPLRSPSRSSLPAHNGIEYRSSPTHPSFSVSQASPELGESPFHLGTPQYRSHSPSRRREAFPSPSPGRQPSLPPICVPTQRHQRHTQPAPFTATAAMAPAVNKLELLTSGAMLDDEVITVFTKKVAPRMLRAGLVSPPRVAWLDPLYVPCLQGHNLPHPVIDFSDAVGG